MITRTFSLASAIIFCIALPTLAIAQAADGTVVLPTEVTIRNIGWRQISNTAEISEFFLAVVETLILVSAFAFHPRTNSMRDEAHGWRVQASLYLFGLIGMLVGFLVVHHGFLIGFVIFGLGSLFRFRMSSNTLIDGTLVIMVTLVGLTVGLNLPVMALVATVASVLTLYFASFRKTTTIELKFADDEALRAAITPIRTALSRKGFRIISTSKADFKPVIQFVLSHADAEAIEQITSALDELESEGHGAKGWYIA